MDASGYTTLTRQNGLLHELQVIANNIANSSTTGFRREGVVFAEYVKALDDAPSLSMAHASARNVDLSRGEIQQTGGTFDFAVDGDGFFQIETPQGNRLTRAGHFTPSATGELVNAEGYRLLDEAGGPVFVPADAGQIALSEDGTLSTIQGPLARIGLWQPQNATALRHEGGTLFSVEGEILPMQGGRMHQGSLEGSNVNTFSEIARMMEVQRAYELGQSFLDREDERMQMAIRTLGG
ncbi:flagellar basal-body rod protein FlgF [Gemmobacter nanjingensis]|uniref:Flagellar basal-body rod protein FlgF n=1 Tax=Gemmobacter nanjingensis TaxID=488454 RepID=A0ABQ3FME8_9RHOB|nr:flagellar hook-basal body complex protein [Gemmobacter nanjingensis]GHC29749.1 flagellar basal-body rod protein FlgF [Gemmobacter nanjingensis]